jgi:hypothetical protein
MSPKRHVRGLVLEVGGALGAVGGDRNAPGRRVVGELDGAELGVADLTFQRDYQALTLTRA